MANLGKAPQQCAFNDSSSSGNESIPKSFIDALDQTVSGCDNSHGPLFHYIDNGNERGQKGWLKQELRSQFVQISGSAGREMHEKSFQEIVVMVNCYAAGSAAFTAKKKAICYAFNISGSTSRNYTKKEMIRMFGTAQPPLDEGDSHDIHWVERSLQFKGKAEGKRKVNKCALPFVQYLEKHNSGCRRGWILADDSSKPECRDDIVVAFSALVNGLEHDGAKENLLFALGWERSDLLCTIRQKMKRILPHAASNLVGDGDIISRLDSVVNTATPNTKNTRPEKETPSGIKSALKTGFGLMKSIQKAISWFVAPSKGPRDDSGSAVKHDDYASCLEHDTPARMLANTPAPAPTITVLPTTILGKSPGKTPARKRLTFDSLIDSSPSTTMHEDRTEASVFSDQPLMPRMRNDDNGGDDDDLSMASVHESCDNVECIWQPHETLQSCHDARRSGCDDSLDNLMQGTSDGDDDDIGMADNEDDVSTGIGHVSWQQPGDDNVECTWSPQEPLQSEIASNDSMNVEDVEPQMDRLLLLADLDLYIDQLRQSDGCSNDYDLSALVIKYLCNNIKKNGKERLIALVYTDEHGRTMTRQLADIPVGRGRKKTSDEVKNHLSLDRLVLDKVTNLILPILKIVCTDEDLEQQKAIILKLLDNVDADDERFRKLTVDECIVIQQLHGLSLNQTWDILSTVNRMLGMKITPSQLRAAISKREKEDALPVSYGLVPLPISKDKERACMFYWHPDVMMIIERLLRNTLIANLYQDSFEISAHVKKAIYFYGLDRGGGDCVLMIRLGNRKDGNKSSASMPLGIAQKAAETAETLEQFYRHTVLGPNLQIMIDKQLHMLGVVWYRGNDDIEYDDDDDDDDDVEDKKDARCIAFEFVYEGESTHLCPQHHRYRGKTPEETKSFVFHPKNLDVRTMIGPTVTVQCEGEFNGTPAKDRHLPGKIKATGELVFEYNPLGQSPMFFPWTPDCGKQGPFLPILPITVSLVKLVRKNNNGDDDDQEWYIGCIVSSTVSNRVMASFQFDHSMDPSGFAYHNVDCKGIMAMPAQDGKMENLMQGLSTCGVTYACPICLMRTRAFTDTVAGATLRKGPFASHWLYEIYKSMTGGEGRGLATTKEDSKQVLECCKSVTMCPFLINDVDDVSGDAMHISQGHMTHLTEETLIHLHRIDAKSPFVLELKSAKTTADLTFQAMETSDGYVVLRRHFQQMQRSFRPVYRSFGEAASTGDSDKVTGLRIFEQAREQLELMEHHGCMTGFRTTNLLIRGYREFSVQVDAAIKEIEKPDGGKLIGQGQFVFRRALTILARDFNKQHGSKELTNAAGIKALEHRVEVFNLAVQAYGGLNDELNREVKQIMDQWLELAELLCPISIAMKGQDKKSEVEIDEFEKQANQYIALWDLYSTKEGTSVFWKMHMLLHLIIFVKKHKFMGRGSSEGFEGKHFSLSKLNALLASMVKDADRVGVLSRRQQLILNPEITSLMSTYGKQKNAPRGPYTQREGSSRREENLVVLEQCIDASIPTGFFKTKDKNLLPLELKEKYDYCVYKKVPESWSEPFGKSAVLGTSAKAKAEYLDL